MRSLSTSRWVQWRFVACSEIFYTTRSVLSTDRRDITHASAFPGSNPLLLNNAASSQKMFRGEEALCLPCHETNYPCTTGFAARTLLKLSRYCRKTTTHSTQATSAGAMLAGASVK